MPTDTSDAWVILHEGAKQYITLAAALLALSATFASRLLSNDDIGRFAVYASWFLLVVSIGISIYAAGAVFDGVKKSKSTFNPTPALLNASVIILGVAAALLAVGAWRTSLATTPSPPTNDPSRTALDAVAAMTHTAPVDLKVDSLKQTSSAVAFTLVLSAPGRR